MPGELSKQFHKNTDFNFPIGTQPSNPQYWPKSWIEIEHKEYLRMPKIELPKIFLPLGKLEDLLLNRTSHREYSQTKPLTTNEISTVLFFSAGVKPTNYTLPDEIRRFYPSGGARYPLETYVAIFNTEGIAPGIYHYNVRKHLLEQLSDSFSDLESLKEGMLYPWSREASAVVFITAVWDRNFIKYKNRGYRITLMEAGHLGQNFLLNATSLGLRCCSSVGFNNERVNEILDITKVDEDSLYMILLGK